MLQLYGLIEDCDRLSKVNYCKRRKVADRQSFSVQRIQHKLLMRPTAHNAATQHYYYRALRVR